MCLQSRKLRHKSTYTLSAFDAIVDVPVRGEAAGRPKGTMGGGRGEGQALLTQAPRPLAATATGLMSGPRYLYKGRLEEASA